MAAVRELEEETGIKGPTMEYWGTDKQFNCDIYLYQLETEWKLKIPWNEPNLKKIMNGDYSSWRNIKLWLGRRNALIAIISILAILLTPLKRRKWHKFLILEEIRQYENENRMNKKKYLPVGIVITNTQKHKDTIAKGLCD